MLKCCRPPSSPSALPPARLLLTSQASIISCLLCKASLTPQADVSLTDLAQPLKSCGALQTASPPEPQFAYLYKGGPYRSPCGFRVMMSNEAHSRRCSVNVTPLVGLLQYLVPIPEIAVMFSVRGLSPQLLVRPRGQDPRFLSCIPALAPYGWMDCVKGHLAHLPEHWAAGNCGRKKLGAGASQAFQTQTPLRKVIHQPTPSWAEVACRWEGPPARGLG